jgi:predicted HTH domain antitoxin
MQVAIELPNDYLTLNKKDVVTKEIQLSYALWLFKQARITIGKAAQLAGLSLQDFMLECKKNQVSVIDTTEQEILKELSNLKRMRDRVVK